ncbi:MAG: tRNA 2-selenouridine(34) synthase MnmH [Chitinophagaceae bacterium]
MAITKLSVDDFIAFANNHIVLDVRSEGEFNHAHIPNAYCLPLFNNDERKVVGTTYKQKSRENAIKIGLEYFGPKMPIMIETVESICKEKYGKSTGKETILVHCWRGGMRSAGIAWLLDLYGFKVYTLIGGYKAYRNWVLEQFTKQYPIKIIGGYTGSGKTYVLNELEKKGLATIDIEGIAKHKGSAFGAIGMDIQPSQEMFENELAKALNVATENVTTNTLPYIFMEDESQRIGSVNIPKVLFEYMRKQTVYFLDIPFEERLNHILNDYGKHPQTELVNAIVRIKKKLGGLDAKQAIGFLLEDDIKNCFAILLKYYDKLYNIGLHKRQNVQEQVCTVVGSVVHANNNALAIMNALSANMH